jgi:uncharacterized membrane protein YdjX (TVP38/TMEM64 family)
MTWRAAVRWWAVPGLALLLVALAMRARPELSLAALAAHQHALSAFRAEHPVALAAAFVTVYVGYAALPLPGAEILTVAAGAVFGVAEGTVLVSVASSVGATLAFLLSRWLLRDRVQRRFSEKLRVLTRGIETEGPFYLFALRLIPLVPFFLVNLLMGLTPLRPLTFFWVSQIGMLPATIAYVNAGLQLGRLQSLSGIVSVPVLLSFAALGLLPLAARALVLAWRRRFGGLRR